MQDDDAMKVVWFSEIKWTYLKTRKQQIIENFPPEWEVLFIESFVLGKNNQFQPVREGRVTYATVPFFKATPYPLINKLQVLWPFRTVIEWIASLWVFWLCRKTGFDAPERVIATSNIYYADIIRRMKKKAVIYDCNDYPLGFALLLPTAKEFFKKTIRLSNVTTTVSKKLVEDIIPHNPSRVSVIGNGVDFKLFDSKPAIKPVEMPTDRPVVFFSGAVAEWFNVELLTRLIESLPEAAFVVLGPIKHAVTGEQLRILAQVYGLILISEKKHAELPSYMHSASVCILPFRNNRRIWGANPNTLYEFLACGKPTVTFGFSEEVRNLAPHVYIADSDEDFVQYVGKALRSKADTEKLKSLAAKNSWSIKAAQMTDEIRRVV
ncbi:MAG TPA: glycosyltransferase [bacterium]|nr:glycosyltransferase [bacterium]HNC49222.1 glycosyltransferase [bacterium]